MSRSRPGSARLEHYSASDRPLPTPRRASAERENFMTQCKAAYLAVFDDLAVDIESKQELCKGICAVHCTVIDCFITDLHF